MASLDDRRAGFKRYKEDVDRRGEPIYPYAMFHETVMSLVVVVVIVALAVIWKWTAHHDGTDYTGWLGAVYNAKADPGTVNFVPRPDWYFYFLFYLLRILRRPVALVAAILVVISMGVLTYKGAVAKEALASEVVVQVPTWAQKEGFAGNKTAVAGAQLFAQSGCTNCHTYLGTGTSNLGAPDLTSEGAKNKGIDFQIRHLKCPSCVTPGSPMPKFDAFSDQNLRELATFIEASKGPK